MAKTKFGIFSLSQVPDLAKVVESFDDDLSFFELAERLGYDKVWIAEHLFSSYGLVTSTQVYGRPGCVRRASSRCIVGPRGTPVPMLQGWPPPACAQALPQTGAWTMNRRDHCQRLRLGVPATPRLAIANPSPFLAAPARNYRRQSQSCPEIAVPRIIAPPAGERLPA